MMDFTDLVDLASAVSGYVDVSSCIHGKAGGTGYSAGEGCFYACGSDLEDVTAAEICDI